jgi:hypothetical protein
MLYPLVVPIAHEGCSPHAAVKPKTGSVRPV